MTTTFFISDLHLGHANILKFEPVFRPFATIEEHDEELIGRWNAVVKPADTVYVLGDVVFPQRALRHLPRLMGRKRLVLGNHDKSDPQLFRHFEKVYGARYFEQGIMTHFPVHPNQLEHRFKYNLHGHTHSHNLPDKRYVNCSVEQINLTPIAWDDLKKRLP